MSLPLGPGYKSNEPERFQAAGHDLLYIEKWVDDLLNLNNKEVDPPRSGSIDHFQEHARRYNACFSELVRKTTVLHPDLARLYQKVWTGTGHFVSRLLSDYEFQLSKGGELEDLMKETLEASQIKVFWNTKETEKAKVDFALQRARSIEFQSELEMLREKTKSLQADNDRLRTIVVQFIEGQDDEDYLVKEEAEQQQVGGEDEEEEPAGRGQHVHIMVPVQESEGSSGSRSSTKMFSRTSSSMSPLPGTTIRPRASHSSSSSSSLSRTSSSSISRQTSSRSSNNPHHGSTTPSDSSSVVSAGSSTTAKNQYMLDAEGRKALSLSLLEAEAQEKSQSLYVRSDHLDKIVQDIVNEGLKQEHFLTEMDLLLRNNDVTAMFAAAAKENRRESSSARGSYLALEKSQSSQAAVSSASFAGHDGDGGQRGSSSSSSSTMPSSSPTRVMVNAGSQTMDKALVDVNKAMYDADMQSKRSRGSHIPKGLRPFMCTFPLSLRIPSLGITINTIMRILFKKLRIDHKKDQEGLRRINMPQHVYEFYKQLYGTSSIADVQVVQFVRALQQHRGVHKRVKLFAKLVGAEDVQAPAPLDLRDVNFIMEAVRFLELAGEFGPRTQDSDRVNLKRQHVLAMTEYLFASFLPDCAILISRRMESMPGPSDTQVDFDDVMEEVTAQWLAINGAWRTHLAYVFKRYSHTFVVLEEVAFANDMGQKDRDTLLVEVPREKLKKVKTRPLRKLLAKPSPTMTMTTGTSRHTTRHHTSMSSSSHTVVMSAAVSGAMVGPAGASLSRRQPLKGRATTNLGIVQEDDDDDDEEEEEEEEEDDDDVDGRDEEDDEADKEEDDDDDFRSEDVDLNGIEGMDTSFIAIADDGAATSTGGTARTVQVLEGEAVVELMDRDLCRHALRKIDHRLEEEFASSFFEEACERMLLKTKQSLEELWEARPGPGGETVYVYNSESAPGITQRTPPYELKTFRTYDIDMETFVDLAIEHEILAKCPFVRLLDKPSEELWANRDVYLTQLQEGTIRQPEPTEHHLHHEP